MSARAPAKRSHPGRSTYHHGDLRAALLAAGLDLAAEGGPEAVVLREVTRRAGVTANAAYRHFTGRDDLVASVAMRAQAMVADAMTDAIDRELAVATAGRQGPARLRGVGLGYLAFALANPGLFKTAFWTSTDLGRARHEEATGSAGATPFQLLAEALDVMVEDGTLATSRRPGAEFLCWSAVHGMAILVIEGPLRGAEAAFVEPLVSRVVDLAVDGVNGRPTGI